MTTSQASTPCGSLAETPLTPSQAKPFNPSWMQAMKSEKPNGLYRPSPAEDESSYQQEMIEPIFAKNRYGREDLLAMMGKDAKVPPEGLDQCPFFIEKAQAPIILMPLTEAEHRTMQQFNSSKALSSLSRQDRHSMLNGEGGGTGSTSSSAWIPAGIGVKSSSLTAGKAPPPVQSRWSALGPSNSRATGLSTTKRTNVDTIATITKPASTEQRPPNSSLSLRSRLRSTSDDNPPQAQQPPPIRLDAISIANQTSTQLSHQAWQGADTKDSFESWKTFEADIANSLMLDADDIIPPDRTSRVTSTAICPPASMAEKNTGERDDETSSQATSRRLTSTHSPQTAEGGKTSQWVYIDPSGNPQGPFDGQKMHNWFLNGYFDKGLRLRKVGDDGFTTLGAIIQANESDPFGSAGSCSPSPSAQPSLRQQQPPFSIPGLRSIVYSNKEIEALESAPWITQPPATVPIPGLSLLEREAELKKEQLLKEKERHIEEERRKLQEKEELLRREMQERDEKERRMREMEAQLKLKEAEIEQIARARNQELENKRLEVAEFERQKREALIQMEEQIRNERLQRQKEEEEVRRAQEEQRCLAIEAETRRRHQEEEARRKQEEQRRLALEAEEKRKREEERKIRAAYEEARRMQEKAVQDGRKASPIVHHMASVPVSSPPVQQYSLSSAPRSWNVIQAPQPVPIQAPKQSAKQSPRQESASSKKKCKGNTAAPTAASSQDPFVKWVIKRVVELNTAVDAEVFAGFIEGIDSPNEVEDYIVSYFGDTKVAHDFLKEFLNKRIELRPRVHNIAKDDLSSALSASGPMQTTANSTGANPAALIAGAGASANKKVKGKQKTLDPNILGFRVVTDPRRVNVGEIDNEPPAPSRRKKR